MRYVIALALLACGPSGKEMQTAKLAHYHASPAQLLQIAQEVAAEKYKIGQVDADQATFITMPRFYSSEGDLESAGAEGWVQVRPGSVRVELIVAVVATDNDQMITVTPRTFQVVSGSPQPRELKPDDLGLPPWVHGRADQLALDIYERAQPYVVAPPQKQ